MAVSLLSHEVSDLCIGKPPLRSLPATATLAEALVALKVFGETFVSAAAETTTRSRKKEGAASAAAAIVGKICMVDVICYLCAEENIDDPLCALKNPVSVLIGKGEGLVPRVETNSSILEALDAILETNSQTLIIPIPKKPQQFCSLTQEDLLRFFLNNIFLFPSIAPLSVSALNLVRPATLSIPHHSPALSTLHLLGSALKENASIAVLTSDSKLIGEISPTALSACDESAAAALAALSAGDLMSYIDYSSFGGPAELVIQAVRARLKEKCLDGMIEFLDSTAELSMLTCLSSALSSSTSSSSDEEMSTSGKKRRPRRARSGSYSARMGRRSEEAIVCHPESSLVAVMVQALAHRVSYVWVVDEEDYGLVGVVLFQDALRLFREQLR